jgi:hypothetical protein
LDRAVAGHDDDLDVWLQAFNLPQDFEATSAWQVEIKKDDIDALRVNQPECLFGRSDCGGGISEDDGSFTARFADEAIAVDDKQVERHSALDGEGLLGIGKAIVLGTIAAFIEESLLRLGMRILVVRRKLVRPERMAMCKVNAGESYCIDPLIRESIIKG